MDQRSTVCGGGLSVHDGGKLVIVDLDQADGILRDRAGLGDHHRDRLSHVTHTFARHHMAVRDAVHDGQRPVGRNRPCLLFGEVSTREDGHHSCVSPRPPDVDADDRGVRVRRADDRGTEHAGQHDVLDEGPAAREEPVVLPPGHGLANELVLRAARSAPAGAGFT